LNELALFAGAGGGILGGKLLGWNTVCAVEYEPHAATILAKRQNDGILQAFPIWDDVSTFDGKPWRGVVDVVSGGFPCQDISSAGKGEGIEGSRSGLWKEMLRIISEVRPRYIFAENSPMLVGRGLGMVLCDLAEVGYDARWCILGADDIGGWHHRKRCWVLAYPTEARGPGGESQETDRRYCDSRRLQTKILHREWNGRSRGLLWESEPRLDRVADGVASGVDRRLARIGNGQVPAVVAAAWNLLKS